MKGKGNASRKGSNVKPNTNAQGSIDVAADASTNTKDFERRGIDEIRASEAPENKQATKREESSKS
ncbi:MAG: hypothetical protein ACOC0N_06980 [Chroococcales cyanobacterium]